MINSGNFVAAERFSQNECLELVKAATLAPSADNNQPWRFVVDNNRIIALLDRHRALPSDVDSMFDLLSMGAALENMRIAAAQFGYCTQIKPLPKGVTGSYGPETESVAMLQFSRGAEPDPLFDVVAGRHTCRKLYAKRPPDAESLTKVTRAIDQFSGVELEWVTSRRDICACAKLIAVGDLVRLEAKEFHAELFRQLRFSAAQVEQTRDGLDVRTLELPPGGTSMLKCLRSWNRMRWIHRLRLGWMLAVPTWRSVRHSGAIGILSVDQSDTAAFLQGGRAFERLWLTVNDEGLSLQPLGSLPIYAAHLDHPGSITLQPQHQQTIRRQLDRLAQIAPQSSNRRLLMMFRIGYATRPRHRSLRRRSDSFISFQRGTSRPAQLTTVTPVTPQIETSSFTSGQDTLI